jgi:hypothetical protein
METALTEPNHKAAGEVLRRMLKTPPKPHNEKKGGKPKPAPSGTKPREGQ